MFMNFSFMNSYFDELWHLTFMRKFMNSSWTLFMNILQKCMNIRSWTVHEQKCAWTFHSWTLTLMNCATSHSCTCMNSSCSFDGCSWTIFTNFSWIIHQICDQCKDQLLLHETVFGRGTLIKWGNWRINKLICLL